MLDSEAANRITRMLADVLIATAVMAISLSVAWQYAGPIAVMSALGAVATYFAIKWPMHRLFTRHRFERTVGLYAEQTGTISSGLAIIRVTDPDLGTPVAQDQALGSGAALALGFPLLIVINLPVVWYRGAMEGYVLIVLVLVAYLAVLLGLWTVFTRRVRARETAGGLPSHVSALQAPT